MLVNRTIKTLMDLKRYKDAINELHYYQEMSNIDAAALMGIGVDALESLLARARRNLRTRLSGQTSPHIDAASGPPPGRANEEA